MPRDYYDILGVGRTADDDEIKKAYRRLAKKYHPDVNKDSGASERFAEVQEAYDALSDTEKRKLYDQFGHAGVSGAAGGDPFGGHSGRTTYGGPGGFNVSTDDLRQGVDLNSIFEQFFGGDGGGGRGAPGGQGGPGGPMPGSGRGRRRRAAPTKGRDILHTVSIPFQQATTGGSVTIKINSASGTQDVDVKIPKGVSDGAKLRLRGKGQPSTDGGAPGDLILTIKISSHPYFRRDGLNVLLDVPISIDEAIFGATVSIPTLTGTADLKIPPGAASGSKLRLRGAGIEDAKGKKGDLLAQIKIDVPKELTLEQQVALEQIKGTFPDARSDCGW